MSGGEDGEFYGSDTQGRCGIKRGNEDNNRKRSDGIVRLDAVLSRWLNLLVVFSSGTRTGSSVCVSDALSEEED